jgi:hypothetical protein
MTGEFVNDGYITSVLRNGQHFGLARIEPTRFGDFGGEPKFLMLQLMKQPDVRRTQDCVLSPEIGHIAYFLGLHLPGSLRVLRSRS